LSCDDFVRLNARGWKPLCPQAKGGHIRYVDSPLCRAPFVGIKSNARDDFGGPLSGAIV
jgi:hypothetical protein